MTKTIDSVKSLLTNPNTFFKDRYAHINKNSKLAFLSSVILGILIHGSFFIHKLINEDSIGFLYNNQYSLYNIGRWFTGFIEALHSNYVVVYLIGIFAILYLAFANAVIISVLGIKRKPFVVLVSLLVIAFPALSHSFGYDFIADAYTCSLLLSVLAVYFTKRYKYGCFIGAICLMLCLALYQSYIGFSIGLFLILLIKSAIVKTNGLISILKETVKYMLCGIIGVAAYLISVKLSLVIYKGTLANYKGTSTIGQIPLGKLPQLVIKSFTGFISFFKNGSSGRFFYVSNFLSCLYIAFIMLSLCFFIAIIAREKLYRQCYSIITLLLLLAVFPVGVNCTDWIAPDTSASVLNTHQFVLFFLLGIALCEAALECDAITKKTLSGWMSWLMIISAGLIGYNYTVTDGIYYFRMSMYYEYTYAFYNRVLDRIEGLDGYRKEYPIAITGKLPSSGFDGSQVKYNEIMHDTGLWGEIVGLNSVKPSANTNKLRKFISNYLGVSLGRAATEEEIEQILNSDKFLSMPIWPAKDSAKIINGIVVVKLDNPYDAKIDKIGDGKYLIKSILKDVPKGYLYAWYIIKDGQKIDTIWYQPDNDSFEYEFIEPGEYHVTIFLHTSDNKDVSVGYSNKIIVE